MRSSSAGRLTVAVATCLGAGFSPVAPGTAGSLAAIVLAAVVLRPGQWSPFYFAALAAAGVLPGIWAAKSFAESRREKDPPPVVIDEVIGQWITLAGATVYNWKSVAGAFLLFRLFDIWKPYPVRQAEKLPHGFGIVLDDVLAGVFAGLVLWALGCFNLY